MKNDPRIIKTLSKLQKAFVILLKNYDTNDINVRQISDEAGVTRGAFYSHFSDKKEFVNYTVNELIKVLFETSLIDSAEAIHQENNENLHKVHVLSLASFFGNVADNYQTYTIVMGANKLPEFNALLKKQMASEFKKFADYYSADIDLGGFPFEAVSSYYVTGLIGMIKKWLEDGMMYTPHYMAKAAMKILDDQNTSKNSMSLTDFFVN